MTYTVPVWRKTQANKQTLKNTQNGKSENIAGSV
jgi:hypothetical protein